MPRGSVCIKFYKISLAVTITERYAPLRSVVVNFGGVGERGVIMADADSRPLFLRAGVVYGFKICTIIKGIIANGSNAIRNGYAFKSCTTVEYSFGNRGNAIRDDYARKACSM